MDIREDLVLLHDNFADAVEDFAASAFARETFGDAFCEHYLLGRRNEIEAFEAWKSSHISDFEWKRYFN